SLRPLIHFAIIITVSSPLATAVMKLLILLAAVVGASLATDCLKCICNKESGCKPIGCNMDVGSLSCGYYQIKSPYYQDCGQPGKKSGESTDTAWKRCADDYNCSSGCVQAYVNRYKSKCTNKGTCEQMSRIHNGGPNGCNVSGTNSYWSAIKSCCGCS
ncbi:ilys-2, partial [Pristionchus pacificus]